MKTKIHGYTTDLRAVYKTFRGFFICIHDAKGKRHCCRITPAEVVHPPTWHYDTKLRRYVA